MTSLPILWSATAFAEQFTLVLPERDVPTPSLEHVEKVSVQLTANFQSNQVTVTPPVGAAQTLTLPPAGGSVSTTFGAVTLQLNRPPAPQDKMFAVFTFSGDADPASPAGECLSTKAAPTEWVLDFGSTDLSGVCPQAFGFENACGGPVTDNLAYELFDPATAPYFPTVDSPDLFFGCRRPTWVSLVLDTSGSMGLPVAGGVATRAEVLENARDRFVDMWDALQTLDPGPIDDRLGVVHFSTNATSPVALSPMDTVKSAVKSDAITPSWGTGLGSGLLRATDADQLALSVDQPTVNRVALLFSDGEQNLYPMVSVPQGGPPSIIQDAGDPATPIPNYNRMQIHTIGLGTDMAATALQQHLADATGGGHYHVNLADPNNDKQLARAFLTSLQLSLAANTWHPVRWLEGVVPAGATAPTQLRVVGPDRLFVPETEDITISPTAIAASAAVVPELPNINRWTITLDNAGGKGVASSVGSGSAAVTQTLQLLGLEGVDTQSPLIPSVQVAGTVDEDLPVTVVLYADDGGLEAHVVVDSDDVIAGEPVPVVAYVTMYGAPLPEFGSQPGDSVKVWFREPNDPPGELIASVLEDQLVPFDLLSAVNDGLSIRSSAIASVLDFDPLAFATHAGTEVVLVDDGTGADPVAGDGIFHGTYTPPFEGTYEYATIIQGSDPLVGKFGFHYLRSLTARAQPTLDASALGLLDLGGGLFTLSLTPRTADGRRIGPGYQGYLWWQASGPRRAADAPVLFVDNFDGTYTLDAQFPEGEIPFGTVYFLPPYTPTEASFLVGEDLEAWTPVVPGALDDTTALIPLAGPEEHDGVPNVLEDIDGDGDPTNDDTDCDGTPNYLDADDDDDGIPTLDEDADGDGLPATDDADGDGLADYLDGGVYEESCAVTAPDEQGCLGCGTSPAGGAWVLGALVAAVARRRRG